MGGSTHSAEKVSVSSVSKFSFTNATPSRPGNRDCTSNDIFDDFNIPPAPVVSTAAVSSSNGSASSSIFDSFDVYPSPSPVTAVTSNKPPTTQSFSSSIFDDFDATPAQSSVSISASLPTVSKIVPSSTEFESNIFDFFDMPPVARANTNDRPQLSTLGDSSENDIFASFDPTSGRSTKR